MIHNEEKYLRPEEVSKILQVTTRSLENWNNQGILKCIRTKGNHRRYLMSDVIAMSAKERQQPKKQQKKYLLLQSLNFLSKRRFGKTS